jgi:hypothetical protein
VLVRPDQHQVSFVEATGMGVTDIDDLEGNAALLGGLDQRLDVDVGEAQQGESLAEEVEDGPAVVQMDTWWPRASPLGATPSPSRWR